MNAEGLRAFDEAGSRAGMALWPGEVVIGELGYPVEVIREPKLIADTAEGGGGVTEEGELVVKILKSEMPEKPAQDGVLVFREKKYRIDVVTGENEADAGWVVECERDS